MNDDEALWRLAVGGDPAAFAHLFDRHRDRVFGQALRFTRSIHDAEDVTALVFLEAWRRRANVRIVNGSVIAWLLVTANYVAKNQQRALRRHRAAMSSLPLAEAEPDFAAGVDDRIDGDGRERAARAAFASLSKRDQDVITLCVIEELSTAEAATALGVPPGTVKSRLSRAKQRLASALSDPSSSAIGGAS